jgi:predicted ester cyclase
MDKFERHAFVNLMRRYAIDYTACHAIDVCDEIMISGYTLWMGGHRVAGREEAYKPAALKQFRQFPNLGFTVHEIITNGDRLALRFSEHGASVRHDLKFAAWGGIGLYRWDGERLTECRVEQDYYSRAEQLATGQPSSVESPAIDPWTVKPVEADNSVEEIVRVWLADGANGKSRPAVRFDDGSRLSEQFEFRVDNVVIEDMFSAGERVAFHVRFDGTYHAGLENYPQAQGGVSLFAAGIVAVENGLVVGGNVVRNRLQLQRELKARA